MDKISHLLSGVLHKRGLKDQAHASHATFLAAQWIADHIPHCSAQLHLIALKDRCLLIEADHPIAAQELMQKAQALCMFLQESCDIGTIDVRVSRSK